MERSKKARVRKSVSYIRSRFSCPAPRKEGVGEAWKEFFTGNISLLGRGGREKGCGEMKRKFGTRVKWFRENYWISRGLPPPRGVSLRGNGGHEFSFFFFFFGYRETCNFGRCSSAERFEFLHFSVSRSKLSYFQRSVKFFFFFNAIASRFDSIAKEK